MDKKTIGAWIMYHEVQLLQLEGLSHSAIAAFLVMNRRTVVKYAAMSEADYEAFLLNKDNRSKLLSAYEAFVKDRLAAHPAASAAQIHDWLKEHHPGFPTATYLKFPSIILLGHSENQGELIRAIDVSLNLIPIAWTIFTAGQIAFLVYFIRTLRQRRGSAA